LNTGWPRCLDPYQPAPGKDSGLARTDAVLSRVGPVKQANETLSAGVGLRSSLVHPIGAILCRLVRTELARMNSIARMLAVYAALSLLLCGLTQMEWTPLQPNGFGQWFALFLLIFPAAAAAEFLGERQRGRRTTMDVEESKSHGDCSWGRIATGASVLLLTIGVVMGAAWWLSHPAAATY
jgi:hypothetical protein